MSEHPPRMSQFGENGSQYLAATGGGTGNEKESMNFALSSRHNLALFITTASLAYPQQAAQERRQMEHSGIMKD